MGRSAGQAPGGERGAGGCGRGQDRLPTESTCSSHGAQSGFQKTALTKRLLRRAEAEVCACLCVERESICVLRREPRMTQKNLYREKM